MGYTRRVGCHVVHRAEEIRLASAQRAATIVSYYNYSLLLPLHFSPFPLSLASPTLSLDLTTMLQRRLAPLTAFSRISSRIAAPATSVAWQRCRRPYSIHADVASGSKLLDLDHTKLSIEQTTAPKPLQPQEELVFGRTFTGIWAPRCTASQPANFQCHRPYAVDGMDGHGRMVST
jgi:hypothetical protein